MSEAIIGKTEERLRTEVEVWGVTLFWGVLLFVGTWRVLDYLLRSMVLLEVTGKV